MLKSECYLRFKNNVFNSESEALLVILESILHLNPSQKKPWPCTVQYAQDLLSSICFLPNFPSRLQKVQEFLFMQAFEKPRAAQVTYAKLDSTFVCFETRVNNKILLQYNQLLPF